MPVPGAPHRRLAAPPPEPVVAALAAAGWHVGARPGAPGGVVARGPAGEVCTVDVVDVPAEPGARAALVEHLHALAGGGDHLAAVRAVVEAGDGALAVLTDHVDGLRLDELAAARGPLRAGEAVTVLVPVAQALASLHRHGRAHGALDAGAITVAGDGRAVVHPPLRPGAGSPADDVRDLARVVVGLVPPPASSHPAAAGTPPDDALALAALHAELVRALRDDPGTRPAAGTFAARCYDAVEPEPLAMPDPARLVAAALGGRRASAPGDASGAGRAGDVSGAGRAGAGEAGRAERRRADLRGADVRGAGARGTDPGRADPGRADRGRAERRRGSREHADRRRGSREHGDRRRESGAPGASRGGDRPGEGLWSDGLRRGGPRRNGLRPGRLRRGTRPARRGVLAAVGIVAGCAVLVTVLVLAGPRDGRPGAHDVGPGTAAEHADPTLDRDDPLGAARELTVRRLALLAGGEVDLASVVVPGSPAARAEEQVLAELDGVEVLDARAQVFDARPHGPSPTPGGEPPRDVEVEVDHAVSAHRQRVGGQEVQVAATPRTTVVLVLRWTPDGWRVAEVR